MFFSYSEMSEITVDQENNHESTTSLETVNAARQAESIKQPFFVALIIGVMFSMVMTIMMFLHVHSPKNNIRFQQGLSKAMHITSCIHYSSMLMAVSFGVFVIWKAIPEKVAAITFQINLKVKKTACLPQYAGDEIYLILLSPLLFEIKCICMAQI